MRSPTRDRIPIMTIGLHLTNHIITMTHQLSIEERYFAEDIRSLMEYDNDFKAAYNSGRNYSMTISLEQLIELCPRKFRKRMMYDRLLSFLKEKGIVIVIQSRKKNRFGQVENCTKPESYYSFSKLSENEARGKNSSPTEGNEDFSYT